MMWSGDRILAGIGNGGMPTARGTKKRDLERPAKAAGRSSRFIAQGLRSGASPKKWADYKDLPAARGRSQKPSSTDEVCQRVSISRFLRSQLRRIGLGHPPGRDPVRTVEKGIATRASSSGR